MEKDKLKLELLEKIIACNDVTVLRRLEKVLLKSSEVNEAGESYIRNIDEVPASYYHELDKEFERYKNGGEQKGASWKDVRKELKKKYGF